MGTVKLINIYTILDILGITPVDGCINSIYTDENDYSMAIFEKSNSFFCFLSGNCGGPIRLFADLKGISDHEAFLQLLLYYPELFNEDHQQQSDWNQSIAKSKSWSDNQVGLCMGTAWRGPSSKCMGCLNLIPLLLLCKENSNEI